MVAASVLVTDPAVLSHPRGPARPRSPSSLCLQPGAPRRSPGSASPRFPAVAPRSWALEVVLLSLLPGSGEEPQVC